MFRGCCTAIGTLSRRGRFRGNTTTISLARPPAGRAHIRSRAPLATRPPRVPARVPIPESTRHRSLQLPVREHVQHPRADESRPSERARRLLGGSSSPRAPPEFHPRPDDPRPRLERGSVARLASRRRGERAHRVLQLPPEAKHAHVRGPGRRRAFISRRLRDGLRGPFAVFAASWAGHDDPRRPRDVHAPSRER